MPAPPPNWSASASPPGGRTTPPADVRGRFASADGRCGVSPSSTPGSTPGAHLARGGRRRSLHGREQPPARRATRGVVTTKHDISKSEDAMRIFKSIYKDSKTGKPRTTDGWYVEV